MKRYLYLFIIALPALCCGRLGNKDKKSPGGERMVSIAKQYTEIMYALGAEANLVAVDVSSTYPDQAKKLPTIGYHRALSVEGILSAKPTLILHDNNIGPDNVVKQLDDLHIPTKVFANKANDIDSTKLLIREMGAYFGKERAADSLCRQLDADMAMALEKAKGYKDSLKVLVIHFGQASNVFLVMTEKSTASKLLHWAGAQIAVQGEKGMMPLSAEVVAASDPDVILLTDFGYDRLGSSQKIQELPGVAATKAARNGRIYRVEEHDLVYLGPRTGRNVLMLQKLLHHREQ